MGDIEMGERAAERTNKTLDRFSSMYVTKNFGYSRKYAAAYTRVFGASQASSARPSAASGEDAREAAADGWREVVFPEGPLGMEIVWSIPPTVGGVFAGSAARAMGVETGSVILQINGRDTTMPLPELELEALMQARPLAMRVSSGRAAPRARTKQFLDYPEVVQRLGVVKMHGVLSRPTCRALLQFVFEEHARSTGEVAADPTLKADRFSNVQTPTASHKDAPITRWDMRLPYIPVVEEALHELLRGGEGTLGSALESLAGGPGAELWELGVVVSEPGAANQPIHFDAAERCLYTAFVALQDISQAMGPTIFLPGTHTSVAHKQFAADPGAFLKRTKCSPALLGAGDAVLYDARALHCGGKNGSDMTRVLLYVTFRLAAADPQKLGIEQHSIRSDVAGRFRLGDFRTR